MNQRIFYALSNRGLLNFLPDKIYLKWMFSAIVKEKLDFKNPKTFNQKLQWLKLYNRKDEYTKMVDKYLVREYIKEKIGEDYLIPLLGVYTHFDEIPFHELPNAFVIKCTHDSGGVVICEDKNHFDFEKAKKKINTCLKRNYYYRGREWPYKNIEPKIIIEKYMGNDLKDYKFMCFHGEVKCSFVCSNRNTKEGLHVTFFDLDFHKMPFERHYPSSIEEIQKPIHYQKMLELSAILSKNIPFVRVDFYEIDGKIYFGELTFFPGNGTEEFTPRKYDELLGEWIILPNEVKNEK